MRYLFLSVLFTASICLAQKSVQPRRIVTSAGNSERIERVRVASTCAASPCTITSQSGSWASSVTRGGVGDYTVNFISGTFSAAPTCQANSLLTSNGIVCAAYGSTTSIVNVKCYSVVNAPTLTVLDSGFAVICMGPR